jgi:uncharacterized protein (TIRG00374 family)
MKKHASLIARIVLASVGLTYITLSLTWSDHVVVPPGYVYPDGVVQGEQSVRLEVTRVTRDQIVAQRPDDELAVTPITLVRANLDRDEASPEFHESIVRTLREADGWYLLWGLLAVGTIYPVQVVRWLILLRCRGMDVAWSRAFRLTMVGAFFNLCMPGTTGGDVLKAYYAAKRSESRSAAIVSVVFDRLTGLFGLVVFAGVAGLFIIGDPLGRRITSYIWLGIAVVVALSAAYFSRRLRKVLGIDAVMRRFHEDHLLNKLDRTVAAYSNHKLAVLMAVLISLPVQLALSWAAAMAGYALGIDPARAPFLLMMVITPVVFLVGSIPITFQGVGVMEWTAKQLLAPTGAATFNQIVGMFLLARLFMIFYSLLGSIYLLRGDIHLHDIKSMDPESLDADADAQPAGT